MRPPARIALLAVAAALAVALAIAVTIVDFSGPSSSTTSTTAANAPTGFNGAALPATARARDFTLTDQAGRRVSLSRYRGQVTILAFLYSRCGPTCTLIAQQIRGAVNELAHPVPVLFVSADPTADTPARVGRFLAQVSLAGRVHYLTGSEAQLQPVWRAYGIVPATSGRAAFDRSASVLLLDRRGRERVLFGVEQLTPEGLSHDVRKLW
jgi:protein SCO1/2